MQKVKELFIKYKEIILYIVFGVLTTAVSFVSYAVCTKLIKLQNEIAGIAVANVISWVCAVLFAFVTNKIWVFESKARDVKTILNELWKFVASRLFTGALEWFGVPLLVYLGLNQTIFGIEGMLSKLIVSVAVVILNYVFSKIFVFKKKKTE
ncbi:MAG: GtrA family protein [Oscillospiraceae bacterium]|nr:GtrA family protein [Oscillospiraceae bacterium]